MGEKAHQMKFLMNIIYSCVNQRNYNVDFFFFLSWSFCHLMSSLFALCHRNSVNAAIDAAATAADTQFVFNFDVCSVHGFCREKNQQFILILLCFHFLEKKEKLCKNRKKCAKFWVFQDL